MNRLAARTVRCGGRIVADPRAVAGRPAAHPTNAASSGVRRPIAAQATGAIIAETPQGPLRLDVYPGEDCAGDLYADDGHSMAFTRGQFFRQAIRCTVTPEKLQLSFDQPSGRFTPWWRSIAVAVHGWPGAARIAVNGRTVPGSLDARAETVAFDLPASRGRIGVDIRRQ